MARKFRPVKTKCFEKFLTSHKFSFNRQASSHHHWRKPGVNRTITFEGNEKDIPPFHIQTCLKTIGITPKEFYEWVSKNC